MFNKDVSEIFSRGVHGRKGIMLQRHRPIVLSLWQMLMAKFVSSLFCIILAIKEVVILRKKSWDVLSGKTPNTLGGSGGMLPYKIFDLWSLESRFSAF